MLCSGVLVMSYDERYVGVMLELSSGVLNEDRDHLSE